jgi:hypothetical protein
MAPAAAKVGSTYEVGEGKTGPLSAGQVVEVAHADDKGVIVTYYERVSHVDDDGKIGLVNAPRNVRLTPAQFDKMSKTSKKANEDEK